MNKAYVPHYPKNPPARATVIVGLPGPTYKVEVTMTAVKGAKEAGAPPFKARDLAAAAKRFDHRSLTRAFTVLAEADLALKGSKRPPDTVLEGAILELTR